MKLYGFPPSPNTRKVQAVAGFFPPTDFFNFGAEGRSAEPVIKNGPFSPAFDFRERDNSNHWKPVSEEKRKAILKQISPIYHVTPQTPPTLLIHGDLALGTSPMLVVPAMDATFRDPDLIGAFGYPVVAIRLHSSSSLAPAAMLSAAAFGVSLRRESTTSALACGGRGWPPRMACPAIERSLDAPPCHR